MNTNHQPHRTLLQSLAHQAMLDRDLLPEFSPAVHTELSRIRAPTMENATPAHSIRDLRSLLWASIDNDDSRDLDQLTVAEALPVDQIKIHIPTADVAEVGKNGSAIDQHARHNTTSVYTAAEIFPMLPEEISTDATSLNLNEERLAVVIEMVIGADGALKTSEIYRAWVRNHAKLAYHRLAAWLEGGGNGS